jgi:hypothetical protein
MRRLTSAITSSRLPGMACEMSMPPKKETCPPNFPLTADRSVAGSGSSGMDHVYTERDDFGQQLGDGPIAVQHDFYFRVVLFDDFTKRSRQGLMNSRNMAGDMMVLVLPA